MKKQIIIICSLMLFLLIGIIAAFFIVRNSEWADEPRKTPHGTAASSFKYTPGCGRHTLGGSYESITEDNRNYIDFVLECYSVSGTILFTISEIESSSPDSDDKSYNVIYQESITEAGTYVFKFPELESGYYFFAVVPGNDELDAAGKFTSRYYYSNWEYLMRRLGLMKD